MKNKSAKRYLDHIEGVESTTLNPEGPGAVRIHLVPARKGKRECESIVVLNGWRIITLKPSWTILLSIFIEEVNKFDGKEMNEKDLKEVVKRTCYRMQGIFPFHSKSKFKKDLQEMLGTMVAIAKGEEVKSDVSMSIIDYADKMAGPLRMDLMVSSMKKEGKWNCNQKCKICYAAGQTNAEVPELSTEDWFEIIYRLWEDAYVSQVTFTGGEPTKRDDLVELIRFAKHFVTRLNTNGLKLENKEYCEELFNASLDSVQITLYSSNPEVHNKLVGIPNGFERTVKGIKNALDVGLGVSINTPIVSDNQDYISTLKFLHELGVIYVTCSGVILTGNATSNEAKSSELTSEGLVRILRDATKFCADNGMEISFTSPGQVPERVLKEMNLDVPCCGACISNMAIAPNGNVVPCQSWLGEYASLGNIFMYDWDDIWNSKKVNKIKKQVIKANSTCQFRNGFNERK